MVGSGIDGGANARRNAWRKISHDCPCGRTVHGNGKAHQRSCETHLRKIGWPLDDGMIQAILNEYRHDRAETIMHVQRELGRIYLERRHTGDKTDLPWREYRDLVWRFAEAAQGRTPAPDARH